MIINSRYKILKFLGSGRSQVFLAEDLLLPGKFYAIKIIPSEKLNLDEIESLRSEFNLLYSLNHPNIVKAYEFGVITDCDDTSYLNSYFYISEYVDGKNFLDFFSFPVQGDHLEYFLKALNQISLTLYYIHQLSIIHYDLRPENILIEGNDKNHLNIKLIDFGFSALKSSYVKGTPLYISPELISGKEVDHRTDLYSLGATLYHVLRGEPPFYSENEIELLKKHLEEKPQDLPDIYPDFLRQIVLKLLEKNPDDRFQNSLQILELLPENFRQIKNIWYIPRVHFAREEELKKLKEFSKRENNNISTIIIISEEGMGKSYLLKKFLEHLNYKRSDYFYLNVLKDQSSNYNILDVLLNQIEKFIRLKNCEEKENFEQKIKRLKELYNISINQSEFIEYRRNLLSELLINLARSFKFLVVIDDYQNLDQITKEFFYYIFPSLVDLGIKFILTVDTSFIRNQEIERFRNSEEIILSPLSKVEIIKMLKAYFKYDFPYDEVADLLIEFTSRSINEMNEFLSNLFFEEILTFDSKGFKLNWEKIQKIDFERLSQKSYELKIRDLTSIQKSLLNVLSLLNFPLKLSELSEILNIELPQLRKEIEYLSAFGWVEISGRDEMVFLPAGGVKRFLFSRTKDNQDLNLWLAKFFERKKYSSFIIAEFYERANAREKALIFYLNAVSEAEKYFSFSSMEKYLIKCIELEDKSDKLIELKYNLAKCYFNQAEFKKAEDLLNEILNSTNLDENKLFEIYLMIAITNYKTGNIEEAYNNFDNAYRYARTDQQKVEVELQEINLELSQGNYTLAMSKCKNLLNDYSEILSPATRAAVYNNLGIANSKAGFYSDAVSYFKEALEIYEAQNNKIKSSQILMNLGNVFNLQNKQEEALRYWKQALELNESIGDLSKKALILNNIGISFFENINLEEAIKYYKDAQVIFEKINDQFGEALSLYNLAETSFLMSDYELALDYVNKSIQLSIKLVDVEGQCQGLFLLGLIYYMFNQKEKLREVSSDLIKIIENHKMQATQLQNYLYLEGLLSLEEKNYSDSEIKLNLARELFNELDGKYFYCKSTLDLMRLNIYTGNFSNILTFYNELQLNDYFNKNNLLIAEANLILGDASKRPGSNLPESSLFYYTQAMKHIENAYIGEVTYQILVAIGEEYLIKGAVNKGLEYFKKAKLVIDYLGSKISDNNFKISYFAHPLRKRTLKKIEKVINNF
jgi:serine/threonine protein kinase/tetratricopeptide (TPR) repeat protein